MAPEGQEGDRHVYGSGGGHGPARLRGHQVRSRHAVDWRPHDSQPVRGPGSRRRPSRDGHAYPGEEPCQPGLGAMDWRTGAPQPRRHQEARGDTPRLLGLPEDALPQRPSVADCHRASSPHPQPAHHQRPEPHQWRQRADTGGLAAGHGPELRRSDHREPRVPSPRMERRQAAGDAGAPEDDLVGHRRPRGQDWGQAAY